MSLVNFHIVTSTKNFPTHFSTLLYHSGWTPFYFMYDPKCSTTFPWCTINAPATFAWCTINVPAAFAWCTNRFVHKVEFSYIGWNGVHPLCICRCTRSCCQMSYGLLYIVSLYINTMLAKLIIVISILDIPWGFFLDRKFKFKTVWCL